MGFIKCLIKQNLKFFRNENMKPLTWEEFESLHRDAWQNGWTYGPAYRELYDDYLVNWIYFVDYLDLLIKKRCKKHKRFRETNEFQIFLSNFNSNYKEDFKKQAEFDIWEPCFVNVDQSEEIQCVLKIFIGEAPPYWAGKIVTCFDKKNYFYLPNNQKKGSYYTVAQNIFNIEEHTKIGLLQKLAEKGFILIDIFPFPIIQETEIRQEVTGAFGEWISIIFNDQFNKCINYVTESLNSCRQINVSKEYAIATPLYGALQICFGETTRNNFINCIDKDFFINSIEEIRHLVSTRNWVITNSDTSDNNTEIIGNPDKGRFKFLLDINPKIRKLNDQDNQISELNKLFQSKYEVGIPILTTGGINLHENFFFNSIVKKDTAKKNLRKKTTVKKPTQKKPPKNSP